MQDVIEAWQAIDEAARKYRETVRAAIASGVSQTEISHALNRTREMIRRDAMPEERREQLRRDEAERLRRRREALATPSPQES